MEGSGCRWIACFLLRSRHRWFGFTKAQHRRYILVRARRGVHPVMDHVGVLHIVLTFLNVAFDHDIWKMLYCLGICVTGIKNYIAFLLTIRRRLNYRTERP